MFLPEELQGLASALNKDAASAHAPLQLHHALACLPLNASHGLQQLKGPRLSPQASCSGSVPLGKGQPVWTRDADCKQQQLGCIGAHCQPCLSWVYTERPHLPGIHTCYQLAPGSGLSGNRILNCLHLQGRLLGGPATRHMPVVPLVAYTKGHDMPAEMLMPGYGHDITLPE